MLRVVVLFLLFFHIQVFALSDAQTLKRADKWVNSSSKTDQFRAYNDYKNIYLRAMVDGNTKLRKKALQGIVLSGNKLHIDIEKYERELKSFNSSKKNNQVKKTPKPTKVYVKSSHKLKYTKWKGDKLYIGFDKKLRQNQLNYFTAYDSKTKRYRYVFEIHAELDRSRNLKKKGIESISLVQYKPTTIRLTFENPSKIKINFKKDSKELIITVRNPNVKAENTATKTIVSTKNYAKDKVIVIDPGHGGKDPGAVGYKKYREKIVVMQISQKLKSILESRGYKVHMTRSSDKQMKLSHRTKFANKKDADLFISIHANAVPEKSASKAHGIECYFLSKSRTSRAKKVAAKENSADLSEMNYYGKESFLNTLSSHNIVASNKLAIDLQRGMLASLNKSYSDVKDGGVREGPFWVLVGAQMPSVLVEVGFITHPTEAKRLANSHYQKRLAQGLANGIERYFLNN
jgi:N-acetylmuramoyl-L-alanine amidase